MKYTAMDMDETYSSTPRGEVCLRGPTVFKGYFKLPEITAATLDSDGWLHTGDVGQILPNNAIKIIDRKKNIFKLAQGEYVAPEKVENLYVTSRFVAQAFVHGDSLQSYLVGILVPERTVCEAWAAEHSAESSWESLCQDEALARLILADVTEIGRRAGLCSFEQIKRVYLYPELFTPESGLLTPTFKLKRYDARMFFADAIEELYRN